MRRSRRLRTTLVVLLVAVPVLAALAAGTGGPGGALDPASAAPAGARALARVLSARGVPVQRVERVAAAEDALAGGPATLVVTDPDLLDGARLARVAGRARALVLLAPGRPALRALAPALLPAPAAAGGARPVPAGCADADAVAAGATTDPRGPRVRAAAGPRRGAQVCFAGAYAVAASPTGAPVRVVAAGALVSNDQLGRAGNAALGLRALGSQPRAVWLVASPLDAGGGARRPLAELLPPWVVPVGVQLALVALAAVAWRSRRLGPLVVEPLPVVVRSVEAAEGRAALYRASRDRGAAAAALRAAARWRLAARSGLAPAAAPGAVAERAAAAAGAHPGAVAALLTGPPPPDDAALTALARDLDALEAAAGAARTPPTEDAP